MSVAPFDLIVLFPFASITITAVIGEDHSFIASSSAIRTIGLLHILVSILKGRYDWCGRLVDGIPVVIFDHGRWHENRMKRLRVQRPDVMSALRQRGLQRLERIQYAVVERGGKVSIIEREPPPA